MAGSRDLDFFIPPPIGRVEGTLLAQGYRQWLGEGDEHQRDAPPRRARRRRLGRGGQSRRRGGARGEDGVRAGHAGGGKADVLDDGDGERTRSSTACVPAQRLLETQLYHVAAGQCRTLIRSHARSLNSDL